MKKKGEQPIKRRKYTEPGNDDAYAESDYDSQGYSVSVKNSTDNSSFNDNGSYHLYLIHI